MQRNPAIDGLRGLAAGMVLALHLYGALVTGGLVDPAGPAGRLAWLFAFGHRGVELFFLISGYLIVGSLVRHRDAARFLMHRLVRVYPAFLLPHLLIFAVGPQIGYGWMAGIDPLRWLGHFVSNLLFLPGLFDLPIANIVAWTLSLEMAFYLLAAAAWVIGQQRSRWRKMAGIGAWLALVALVLHRHPRTAFFAAGALVWWLQQGENAAVRRFQAIAVLDLVGVAGLCLLFERAFAASLVCGLVALVGVVGNRGLLCRLLGTRALQYLGDISYSLYLWHPLVLFAMKRMLGPATGLPAGQPANVIVFLVVAVGGSLVAGDLSYRWIEEGFTRRYLQPGRPERAQDRRMAPCTHAQAIKP